jgi:TP53 regulating kinase and related kinases
LSCPPLTQRGSAEADLPYACFRPLLRLFSLHSTQVLIDFGLSSVSFLPEDRAVDLYVLERAFASTHPVPLLPSGEEGVPHFEQVLLGYQRAVEEKGKKGEWTRIEKRLEEVRMRGRKRSMVG